MSGDGGGLRDEAAVELNPAEDADAESNAPEPLPERPAETAPKAKWVAYVVALGADEEYVSGDTTHWTDEPEEGARATPDGAEAGGGSQAAAGYVTRAGLSRGELIELAGKLGG